jgi:hypothetical protein
MLLLEIELSFWLEIELQLLAHRVEFAAMLGAHLLELGSAANAARRQ